MKKIFSIVLIVVLTFFTVNPLPPALAAIFPASIGTTTYDDASNEGTVPVIAHEVGLKLTLHKAFGLGGSVGEVFTSISENQSFSFKVSEPGMYFVTAITGSGVVTQSENFKVAPPTLTKIESTKGTYSIIVSDAKVGSSVNIYNKQINNFNKDPETVDGEGKAIFKDLPAGKDFKVTQTINGAESELSGSKTVYPSKVTLKVLKDSGEFNNAGEIEVTNSKKDNTLILYKDSTKVGEGTANSFGSLPFAGLSAGNYSVVQIENGLESDRSDPVVIENGKGPTITLEEAAKFNITYPTKYELDKDGPAATAVDYEGKPVKVTVSSDMDNTGKPGIYKVTYRAEADGLISTEIRTVTILPETVGMIPIHTNDKPASEEQNQRATGDIQLNNVYQGATLYLYQDPSDEPIRTIPYSSLDNHLIKNIPVGKDYYVVQEVGTGTIGAVKSEDQGRVDILDTTDPILKLNGTPTVELVVGEKYDELSASATDNVPDVSELKVVIGGDIVDTSKPGIYIVTYDVIDNARRKAKQLTRTITIKPQAVKVIGSTAKFGEIGVTNIFPGSVGNETVLTLYKLADDNKPDPTFTPVNHTVQGSETTYVFKKYGPGRYYVKQTVYGQVSSESNIAEIVDVDIPHITLNGPEKLSYILDVDKEPYYYVTPTSPFTRVFHDPGMTAKDYLEPVLTTSAELIKPNGDKVTCLNAKCTTEFTEPGVYTITYSAFAPIRQSQADDKHRTITVAPPKIKNKLIAEQGKSTIAISGVYSSSNTTAVVKLYDTYNQLINSVDVKNGTSTTFTEVPAGLGYYVTQTVNGIESAPSDPVNVSLFEGALDYAGFESFEFTSIRAYGSIDHETRTIQITVPKDTDVTKLKASFKGTGTVKVGNTLQTSAVSEQNFTNQVTYTIESQDQKETKKYVVTVTKAILSTNTWTTTMNKNVSFSTVTEKSFTLTPAEKLLANEKGISFIAPDRAIHIPAANVQNASSATLKVTTPTSVAKTTDPAWRTSIKNVTELNWGNSTTPFLQPIEVEMPNPDEKKFARLVRENNKLYAIIQPSEKQGDNIVGLATEPGTYALIDDITKPNIILDTLTGETTYRLSSNVAGTQIYYTTNSSSIAFDRSARKPSLNNYSLDGVPSDLSNWTLYQPGERISVPNGELYAFTMKDQMISLLNAIEPEPAKSWKNKDIQTVERHKVWKIQFNARVDKKALYSNSIYVTDDTSGKVVATTLDLSRDGKILSVIPAKMYDSNKQYTLWIDKQMKGNTVNQEFLKQPTKITFIAK